MKPLYELSASARWDRLHLFTVSAKLDVEETAAFDAACASRGLTRYAAIRRFCLAVIQRPEILDKLRYKRAPRKRA